MVEPLAREIEGLRALFRSERDPEGRAFVPLADAYRRSHDLKRALDVLNDGLEQHPELASAHVVSAWIHRDRGDRASARTAWKRVLELDEENVEALRGLGTLLLDSGRTDEARPYLEKLRSLDPDASDVHGRLALLEGERPQAAPAPAAEAAQQGEAVLAGEVAPAIPAGLAVEPLSADEWPPAAAALPSERQAPATSLVPEGVDILPEDRAAPAEKPAVGAAGAESLVESASGPEHAEPAQVAEPVSPHVPREVGAGAPHLPDVAFEQELRPEGQPLPPPEPPEPRHEPQVIAAGAEMLVGDGEIMEVWGEGTVYDEEEGEPAELPATRTLAELFARQGLHARAAEIYERLIEESPEDDQLRDRLAELRGVMRPKAAPQPPSVHAEDTEAIAAQMGGGGAHAEPSASPFGWTPDEAGTEELEAIQEGGAPISLYFRRLLEWTPAARAAPAPEAPSTASTRSPPAEPVESSDVDVAEKGAAVLEPAEVAEDPFEGIVEERAIPDVVPIRSLAPDRIVPIEELAPSPVVPIAALAPDAVPIESLAPDAEPSHDSSTILF